MIALEEIVIWLVTRSCRVKIDGQISYTSLKMYLKYREIWKSNIKTDVEVVTCVLDRQFYLVRVYEKMADC
jgi:hypothetical protein